MLKLRNKKQNFSVWRWIYIKSPLKQQQQQQQQLQNARTYQQIQTSGLKIRIQKTVAILYTKQNVWKRNKKNNLI